MRTNLADRLYDFALQVIIFLRQIPNDTESRNIKSQLIDSVTSAGANYEEAQAAASKADFRNKVIIALKEMRECNYWIRIFAGLHPEHRKILCELAQESKELMLILGSIGSKAGPKRPSSRMLTQKVDNI